jgi:hypothetical protein
MDHNKCDISYHMNKYMYKSLLSAHLGGKRTDNHHLVESEFYFTHFVWIKDNMEKILEDGVIKLSKDIPSEMRPLSGPEDSLDYVYANIQFNDLQNLGNLGTCVLLLHPQLAYDQDWVFNTHWSKYPTNDSTFVYRSDSVTTKMNLTKIKEYVYNPTFYAGTAFGKGRDLQKLGKMSHEILFTKEIPLDKYLLGVIYEGEGDGDDIKKIEKLVKKYPNATLFKTIDIADVSAPIIRSLINPSATHAS